MLLDQILPEINRRFSIVIVRYLGIYFHAEQKLLHVWTDNPPLHHKTINNRHSNEPFHGQ